MPSLRRCYRSGYLNFITFGCYRRFRLLGSARRRDLLLRDDFVVVGYVVMPEHVHLLISEPDERVWRWSSFRYYALDEHGGVPGERAFAR